MRFADAAPYAIAPRLEKVFVHEQGARAGEDIEEVHDMRVASRRLRAAMTVFAPCFARHRFKPLQRDAARLTQALGGVRDADVMLAALDKLRRKAEQDEVPGIDDLIAITQQQRDEQRKTMLETFDALLRDNFKPRLEAEITQARHKDKGDRAVADIAQHIGARCAADLYGFTPYIHDPARVEALHEMRKAAKRLRYSLEIFHACFADDIDARIEEIKDIQEQIGQIHDCDVLMDLIQSRLTLHSRKELDHWSELAISTQSEKTRKQRLREALTPGPDDPRLGLLSLLGQKRQERERRYSDFITWWDTHQADGLRERLYRCIASATKEDQQAAAG